MMLRYKLALLGILFLIGFYKNASAQNINGFKITVGKDAPAFLIFNDDVKSFEFNATDGYKFYDIIRRSGNAVSITYKRESGTEPTIQTAIVSEGKRTHSFQIIFDPKYDINKNNQLVFDYSDLKNLRKMVAQGTTAAAINEAEMKAQQEEDRRQAELAKKEQEAAAEKKKNDAMQAAKNEAAKKKQQEAEIAKAQAEQKKLAEEAKKAEAEAAKEKERVAQQQKEAERVAAAEKKKRDQEEQQKLAAEKKAAEDRKKESDRIAAQQAADEAKRKEELKKITDAKERAEKEKLAQQKAEQAKIAREEAARKEEQKQKEIQAAAAERARIAKQKEEEAEQKRLADNKKREEELEQKRIALEKKKQEQEEQQQRLAQMEEERKRAAEEKKYSYVGLWERYGSKGVNIYDMPEGQHELNNGDFYLTKDTLRNYTVSEKILADNEAPLINIKSKPVKAVTMTLENIHFMGGNVYYTINIDNQGNEDFLQGVTGLYWYNKSDAPYKWLNCSYYTYIDGVNIVRPQSSRKIVFVTRLADVADGESLQFVMQDRRNGSEKMSLVVDGAIYNKELKKTEIGKDGVDKSKNTKPEKPSKKKKKKDD